jgi:hypothetical protein
MLTISALSESIITEAALTKGSQQVLNNKNTVANLADAIRDDAVSNPIAFPAGFARTASKTKDEDLAKWFLENLDRIEREGYEGTIYSRDGQFTDWIVRRYIAGSHSWEDLVGVMNMNMRDWYLLKNRRMLAPNHMDIPKYNSVRDLGVYLNSHYKAELDKVRDAAKNAARNKMAKSVKLVDNEDYRIYTTLNRAAGCLLGLGTQWCTANSNYAENFHSYSGRAMLFQMFPYQKDDEGKTLKDEAGKKVLSDTEKYQFDAGGPSFMNVNDTAPNKAMVVQKYPYIYSDLSKALLANKEKMEKAFEELDLDPTLQHSDYKIKKYDILHEIEKLQKFVNIGYFTTEERPSNIRSHEEPGNQPQVEPAQQPQLPQPPQGNQQMENVDKDVAAMLESLKKYDNKLMESVAPVLEKKTADGRRDGVEKEDEQDDEDLNEKTQAVLGGPKGHLPENVNEGADTEVLEWMKRFEKLGKI